ncbi:unnamed protein product [Rotaria magnacalcarata]|uniref:Membrane-bound transcription factor site-1 protease-like N-terminal domain-containing protein n=1 Tax=Rotaria magnacalcarata TaxID=392030 RepID=A0A8S3BA00_9BILA|nr:unnamed protein product [Rotaria magnacalcarata]
MVNVLIKTLFIYFLLYTSTATIDSDEIFPCNETTNLNEEKLSIEYEAKTIQDEFIVQFTGYYTEVTRKNYLARVFERNNVFDYEIIKRTNLMQSYPSDFDIVRVCSLVNKES